MKWTCLQCKNTEGVVNGVCRLCGPTKTQPADKEAEKEAGVDAAATSKEQEEIAKAEAADRNNASIEAGAGSQVDAAKL